MEPDHILLSPVKGVLDPAVLARWMLDLGREEGALMLSDILRSPRENEDITIRCGAGLRLAATCRRRGLYTEAEAALRTAFAIGCLEAGIELAKLYEHRLRDLDAARAVLRVVAENDPALSGDPEFRRRVGRVERKRDVALGRNGA